VAGPFPGLTRWLQTHLDYPGLSCDGCWEQHCRDGAPYPCLRCPDGYLRDPDRLALSVWRLLGSGERPVLGILALEVLKQQLPDLAPAEWLGLLDRLALIDRILTEHDRSHEMASGVEP